MFCLLCVLDTISEFHNFLSNVYAMLVSSMLSLHFVCFFAVLYDHEITFWLSHSTFLPPSLGFFFTSRSETKIKTHHQASLTDLKTVHANIFSKWINDANQFAGFFACERYTVERWRSCFLVSLPVKGIQSNDDVPAFWSPCPWQPPWLKSPCPWQPPWLKSTCPWQPPWLKSPCSWQPPWLKSPELPAWNLCVEQYVQVWEMLHTTFTRTCVSNSMYRCGECYTLHSLVCGTVCTGVGLSLIHIWRCRRWP